MELLLGDACRHTVTALTHLETCRMPVDTVRAKIRQDPEIAAKLFRQWQDGVDNADTTVGAGLLVEGEAVDLGRETNRTE